MADGGGFVLNIAASSGAARPAKKKKSTFRAKKNAKKSAKAAGSEGGGDAQHKRQHPAHQQQHSKGSGPNRPPNGAGRAFNAANKRADMKPRTPEKKKPAPTKSESPVAPAVKVEEEQEVGTMDVDDEAAESSDDEIEIAVATATELKQEVSELPSPSLASKTVDDADDSAQQEGAAAPAKTAFGTRRNPNKEGYDVSKHMQVRASIDHVLEKPLESTSSDKIFAAETTFEKMALSPKLVQVLQNPQGSIGFGFARPTNVQVQSIPAVLSGKDVLVKSETGSGKTLSYLLPVVQQLQAVEPRIERSRDGCVALILAPTRELCLQILETATKLVQPFVYIVPGAIIGGEKKKAEKARLRKGICILVATPGRLADHLVNTQSFNYSNLRFLVLDEADRLLDMGFEKQITQILSIIDRNKGDGKPKRQNILVSATINSGVQQLATMSLSNPVCIDADALSASRGPKKAANASSAVESFSTPHQLMQHFMIVPAKARLCALTCFLREELNAVSKGATATAGSKKIVVFMSTCDSVDFHYELFRKCAWPGSASANATDATAATASGASLFGAQGVYRLHGTIPQHERMSTFKNFCAASSGVLLCTDVAARGLNLPTVHWIVQYDPPTETRDYVHRVGRTARSGKQGSSLLFLMPAEAAYLDHLKQHNLSLNALSLEKTITRVTKTGGSNNNPLAMAAVRSSRKKLPHEAVQSELQFLYEQTLLGDKELFELACQAFHSFVRSYATHTADTRAIFHVRGLHFGHVAKSFALRDPPASNKLRDAGRNAKKGTLQKRKDREEKLAAAEKERAKRQRMHKRKFAQQVSEFAD